MNKIINFSVLLVCGCFLFSACIQDTDFEQADDVALTPIVELDLIYFNLPATHFYDSINATPILTVRDTTQIKFLDDSSIQDNLIRAEFYFKFTNSIPRSFLVDFQFLSERNDTTYVTATSVNSGTVAKPVNTEFFHNVAGEDILELTKANKVVVSVTIPSSEANLDGVLNLKSKTTYFFEKN
ncbi:hypothetical protein [Aequorivita sp. Q41]|uniref:hypothetical protein n=1 Tax=Aequorivita sp. Q41 TaxID=3153300 RepID=UPI003242B27B